MPRGLWTERGGREQRIVARVHGNRVARGGIRARCRLAPDPERHQAPRSPSPPTAASSTVPARTGPPPKPSTSAPAPRPKPPGSWSGPARKPSKPPRAAARSKRRSARSRTKCVSCAVTSSAGKPASPTVSSGWTQELKRIEDRAQALSQRKQDLERRAAELDKLDADRSKELERVAGLTADAAKAELVASDREPGQARGGAHRPGYRARGPVGGRDAGPQDRHPGHPAGGERADQRVRRLGAAPAGRRDEGPHHRPRGPQHPRLRVGDRRQPDHRRHPRGGAALLLRPGPARDRPAHAGTSRARRAHPPAADRGGLRAQQGRDRAAVRAGRRGRPGRARHHRHAPGAGRPARAAALPHLLRAERAQAPGRVGAHRRDDGQRAAAGPGCCSSGARCCTTSARRSPTRSRAATR